MNTQTKERRATDRPADHMYSKLVYITPEMAERWLELNTRNRNLSVGKVSEIIRDWEQHPPKQETASHQGIAFYKEDGALADGQTRLSACAKSRIPFWSMVTWNVPEKSAQYIDRHRSRSEADAIRIAGLSDWIGAKEVALIKMIVTSHRKGTESLPVESLVEMGEAIKEPVKFAMVAFGGRRLKHVTVNPVLAAVAIASVHVDQVRLLEFAEVLISGVSESTDDVAAIRLRDSLITEKSRPGQTARREILLKTMRAIKAFDRREKIQLLRAPKEMLYRLPAIEERL